MDREYIEKLIPLYLDEKLDDEQKQQLQDYLKEDPDFQQVIEDYSRSWALLEQWEDIEPQSNYVSRFWTELSSRTPWYEKLWSELRHEFFASKFGPAAATVCVVLIVGFFAVRNYVGIQEAELILSAAPEETVTFIKDIELAENFNVIKDIDLLEDLDVLEYWVTEETHGS